MNKMIFAKAVLVTALPLSLAVSALADDRTNARDKTDPGTLNTNNTSLMSREEMERKEADARVARGMERDQPRAMLDENRREESKLLNDATEAYRALTKGPHGTVPQSVIDKAECVAIIPNVITAAAVVGGSHGNGVASCKNAGKWSPPAFVDLNVGSLGAQIGAKSTDIVMYFTNDKAVNALKRGKFAMGADASVVAGNFDRAFDTANAGVIAYQRSSGAYLGASLSGGTLSSDTEANRASYGRALEPTEILEGRISASDRPNPLTSVLH